MAHYMPLCVPCHTRYDDIGATNRDKEYTEKDREKYRAAQLARPASERSASAKSAWETRRANGNDKVSQEQRTKISKAGKGRVVSEESRLKASASNKGKKRTFEQRETIKVAQRLRRDNGRGPLQGPDGRFISRVVYETEVGQSCEI